jgi:membrane-bound inhibitor of C-type lysozyme
MLKHGCITLALAALLGGCAGQPAASDEWTRWVCDNHTEVLWRFADASRESLDLRLGGGDIAHRLHQQPAASGVLYRDYALAFHTKGEEGVVYRVADDGMVGSGCKAR